MQLRFLGGLLFWIIVVGLAMSSFFVINEGQEGLIFHWGRLDKNSMGLTPVLEPGLHFKWPLASQVKIYDIRTQTFELNVPLKTEGLTGNQSYLVYWKINDLQKFYSTTAGDYTVINELLNQRFIGQAPVLLDSHSPQGLDLMNQKVADLGIQIQGLYFKGYVLTPNSLQTIYQSMRDSQVAQVKSIRLNAKLEADGILADKEAQADVIRAQGDAKASQLRATGDNQAAKIYADAYGRDPSFYAYLINLDAYAKTFNSKQDWLVLTPNMAFFQDFNQPEAKMPAVMQKPE